MRGHVVRRTYKDRKTGKTRKMSTWSVRYDEPRADGEKRQQKFKSGFATKDEAQAWLDDKRDLLRYGVVTVDPRMTVAQYLASWLTLLEGPGSKVKAAALHAYRNHVDAHIVPAIGAIKLTNLHVGHVEAAKSEWSSKRRSGKKERTLSARTVRHIFTTLNTLNRAKRQRLIAVNPCELTEAPTVEREEIKSLGVPQATALLRAFEGTPLDAAIVTALGTGLRRGELLALRWRDIDLDVPALTVNRAIERDGGSSRFKDPKTKRSRRTINLPVFVAERLRRHRVEQAERFLGDGLGRPNADTLVFERGGEAWIPNSFTTFFWRTLHDAGLPHCRLHDLRHSFASMALEAGVDLKTVSSALGHSTITTTADVYAHLTSSLMRDAAAKIDAAIGGRLRRASGEESK